MVKVKCQYCGNAYEVLNEFETISSICPKCGWEQDEHITEEWDYSDINHSSIKDYVPISFGDKENLYMGDLKKLVDNLSKQTDPKEIVRILQDIGAKLINEYEIQVGNLTIEPLLVEAYYYHKGKFEDNSVYAAKEKVDKAVLYARSRQQKNQGKLFIHFNDWGIDICLSDSSDYYLSYLIKNALVNGEWQTQKQIGMSVCQKCSKYEECKSIWECQYNDIVALRPRRPHKNGKIIFVPRVRIEGNDLLAALSAEDLANEMYDFTLPTGYGKQWKISVCALLEIADEEKAKQLAKKKNGAKIDEEYWKKAKETLNRS